MDGSSAKKSTSFETLVIQNISNVNDLKTKLKEIISSGKDYEYNVASCLKSLLKSNDSELVLLTIQAISELAKCEEKREMFADPEVIKPILNFLSREITSDTKELIKQCCRALGNLCCDGECSRTIILKADGTSILIDVLNRSLQDKSAIAEEIKMLSSKALLNYAIGGQEYSKAILDCGLVAALHKILVTELEKDDMNDDMVTTALLLLNIINDYEVEIQFEAEVLLTVLNVLRETTNFEISEYCLDQLYTQAEHDAVKTLLAKHQGVQLVCQRLEQLLKRYEAGEIKADDAQVLGVISRAMDLVTIVLTGDEAMHILYDNGRGEVYSTIVKWLDIENEHLLTTAMLAVGNFARQDDYCTQMMQDHIFDKLLDIFKNHHHPKKAQPDGLIPNAQTSDHTNSTNDSTPKTPDELPDFKTSETSVETKIQHAALSALRNLTVPVANKREAVAKGRAVPLLLDALPDIEDPLVAYKLLAAIRMLVDGQEQVAIQLASHPGALAAVRGWGGGRAGAGAGAAGEAPRLLAWTLRGLRAQRCGLNLVQVEGCIASLVNMLVACHSVMQNEALLALTLLAEKALKPTTEDFDYQGSFTTQLIDSEIGKHISVLIETNCAKMPIEVAENLIVFLHRTFQKDELARDYNGAKVHEWLQKFMDARKDFSENMKACASNIISTISDLEKE